jgi:hypothetical protein
LRGRPNSEETQERLERRVLVRSYTIPEYDKIIEDVRSLMSPNRFRSTRNETRSETRRDRSRSPRRDRSRSPRREWTEVEVRSRSPQKIAPRTGFVQRVFEYLFPRDEIIWEEIQGAYSV